MIVCVYCTARFFKSHSLKRRRKDLTTYNRPVVGGMDGSKEERKGVGTSKEDWKHGWI